MRMSSNSFTILSTTRAGGACRKGSPLSPLLLNVYLVHFLDTRWRKLHPDLPLLRYADDSLILCRTEEEAQSARLDLEQLLTPAAMLLKHCDDPVRNLALGKHAEWLGYQIAHSSADSTCDHSGKLLGRA